jgi:hypothetical protein
LFGIAKKILFWSYGRTSWQYDVMCAVILAFIFLTPLAWFKTGEPAAAPSHQNGSNAATRLLIPVENLPANPGANDLERRAREQLGRPVAKVKAASPLRGEGGRVVAYEVDIE